MENNSLVNSVKAYMNNKVKELYGFDSVVDMFVCLKIEAEFNHFENHVAQCVHEIATADPFTQLFGFVVEGSEHQQTFDHFINVAHDKLPNMTEIMEIMEIMDMEMRMNCHFDFDFEYDDDLCLKIEYENEGNSWLFGNYNQGSYCFKEERQNQLIKSSKKFKDDNYMRIAKKYLNANQKFKKNLGIENKTMKKMSKRSGKKQGIEYDT